MSNLVPVLSLVFFLTALTALGQPYDCGEPPPVADQRLKGEIDGKAQFISRFLGGAELTGSVERSREEIFSKYANADERSDAYFEYQFCVIIRDDTEMTATEKIRLLSDIRREFKNPVSAIQHESRNDTANFCAINDVDRLSVSGWQQHEANAELDLKDPLGNGGMKVWQVFSRNSYSSGLNVTKESRLGFRSGLRCASHADAHRSILHCLERRSIPA